MTMSRRRRWRLIAGVAMLLQLVAGWNGQACGQQTNTVATSTTAHTTNTVQGGVFRT